jgi:hypothetical protein
MFDADLDDLASRLEAPRDRSTAKFSRPARGLGAADGDGRRLRDTSDLRKPVGPGGIEPPTDGL